jgi:hypothetical protein
MGRLTLNMLLSFAQFEREVTAERIRDKIAASKAKGMWMGGTPPVGYAPHGRTLSIVEPDAAMVRDIFGRYLTLKNVRLVAEDLRREGIRTPARIDRKGRTFGGQTWSRGQIYKLLSNPIYIGQIEHKAERYPGLHPAIVDLAIWNEAQTTLAANLQGQRSGTYATQPSLLAGKVEDQHGAPLACEHASKADPARGTRTRYRYYVGREGSGLRVPARELETVVLDRVRQLFMDPITFADLAGIQLSPIQLRRCEQAASTAKARMPDRAVLCGVTVRVSVLNESIQIECSTARIADILGLEPPEIPILSISAAARVTRTGRVVRIVDPGGAPLNAAPDTSLLRLIAKGHRWWAELRKGEADITALAASQGVMPSYMTRVLRLAFLSPAVIEGLLGGRQSTRATVQELTLGSGIEPRWSNQSEMLLK